MNKIINLFFLLLLFSCSNKKEIKEYYSDGTLKLEYSLYKGKKEGRYLEYYQSGKIKLENFYKNGRKYGIEKQYNENGILEVEGEYLLGGPNGWFYFYDEEGILDSAVNYAVFDVSWSPLDYFKYDMPPDTCRNLAYARNMVIKYNKDGSIDVEKSVYCEVSCEENEVKKGDSIKFIVTFSNPYKEYGYNPDSTIFIFSNDKNFYSHTVAHYPFKEQPFSVLYIIKYDKKEIKEGINWLYLLIILQSNNGEKKHISIKTPFEIR